MTHRLCSVLLLTVAALLLASPAAAQFDTPSRQFHDKTTFRLEGRHVAVACESCHLNNVFKGTPTKCFDCHWARRKDDRFQLQLGAQCEQCHTPVAWTSARFDHGALTGMVLSGAHRALACQTCHKTGDFRVANSNCVSCHLKDYQKASNPSHVAGGFPTTCETCHRASDTSFSQATFNHQASFPLVGQHLVQACVACHTNNVFKGTARDCVGCHRVAYNRTTSPPHAAAGFGTSCESCHRATDASFKGASFSHAAFFPLVGLHAQQACATCHVNNVFKGTARDCVGCHRNDYNRTVSPPHASSGFGTSCESCHRATDSSWRGSTFNHAAAFPLVGVHAQQACASCHVNNVFRGTPRDCVGCHRTLYTRTTSPPHAAAGFGTTCESCHRATDTTWRGASFNHSTVFALVGVHAQQACTTCHVNNVYRGTARDCVGCHRAKYDRTGHAASGFSTSCEGCHRATDSAWSQGTFNHTRFPITSGRHKFSCVSCHLNPASYQSFTCLTCHEKGKMDSEHRNRNGYRYDSLACYSCHPTGRS